MALMPAIMSLFGGKETPPAAAAVVSNPATTQVAAAQTTVAGANPTVPSPTTLASNGSVPAIPPAGVGDASPLANFNDLWKTDPNQNQTNNPSLVPNFNLDPKGLMDAAAKVNFTQHIPPELVAKAMSGDATAFLEVINKAQQYGFASSAMSSGELIKNSLGSAQNVLRDSVLPAAYRDQQISQALNESSPIFADPAVAPMLGMLKTQFQQKYPTASPQEIASLATQYLGGMSTKIVQASGGTVTPKGQQPGNNSGFPHATETDWTNFFNA